MTYVELRNAISEINTDVWHRVKSADDATDEIGDLTYSYIEARVREALEQAVSVADQQHFGGEHDDDLGWTGCAAHIASSIRDLTPKP